ncbi:MAG: substrate-binding domain-containing protein [Erysipelotrichaceae bacterium]|nr:substrate-binding domain-containing protein [Erysipelotrichaceae bacterium]
MKKILTILLAIAMVFALTACNKPAEEPVDGGEETAATKVWFVAPLATGSAWGTCGTAFLAECEKLGLEGKYEGPIQAADIPAMIDLCDQAIADGADVLICNWRDLDSFNDVADRAIAAGIKLIGYNMALPERCPNYLGIDPSKLGEVQAQTIVDNYGTEGINVLYLNASATSQSHAITQKAFEDKLLELAPTAVITVDFTSGSADVAAEKVSTYMNANPDINCIACNCSFAAVAAAAYREENSLTKDQLYVQGIDGGADILQYVLDGFADCTIIQDWTGAGQAAAQLAQKMINGEELPEFTGLGAYPLYADGVKAYADSQGITLN